MLVDKGQSKLSFSFTAASKVPVFDIKLAPAVDEIINNLCVY